MTFHCTCFHINLLVETVLWSQFVSLAEEITKNINSVIYACLLTTYVHWFNTKSDTLILFDLLYLNIFIKTSSYHLSIFFIESI